MCSTAPTSTHTHKNTQRQTDRKEKDEGKKTEKESERKGQGQIGGREERTPPCLLHTRDSGALVTSCLFKRADCIVITDWLKPFSFLSVCFFPPRFFFTHCPFLFCFYKQQKGRQSLIKAGDILPLAVKKSSPASPHPTVWMGRSHKLGGSHRITLPGLSSPAPPQHPPTLHNPIIHEKFGKIFWTSRPMPIWALPVISYRLISQRWAHRMKTPFAWFYLRCFFFIYNGVVILRGKY